MGQKVHPNGYRIGVIEPWRSRWYATKKHYGRLLIEDHKIREHIRKEYASAGVPRIEIERTGEAVNIIVYTARPGVLVGRKGVRVETLKKNLLSKIPPSFRREVRREALRKKQKNKINF